MRHVLMGFAIAATTTLAPVLAWAGNQEMAEQIAGKLRDSGQLKGYNIAVKFQDGTVWLKGRVADEQQESAALKMVFQMSGVNRVINEMSAGQADASSLRVNKMERSANPLRTADVGQAQRVPSSYNRGTVRQTGVAMPMPMAVAQAPTTTTTAPAPMNAGAPIPMVAPANGGPAPARFDQPCMPNYSWPSYAAYPNYAGVTYPRQYSPTAWPFIGPFYPYPQVPLGWRKVTLEWDDGWWFLDFKNTPCRSWTCGH